MACHVVSMVTNEMSRDTHNTSTLPDNYTYYAACSLCPGTIGAIVSLFKGEKVEKLIQNKEKVSSKGWRKEEKKRRRKDSSIAIRVSEWAIFITGVGKSHVRLDIQGWTEFTAYQTIVDPWSKV